MLAVPLLTMCKSSFVRGDCSSLTKGRYVSTLFLYKLYGGFTQTRDSGRITNGQGGQYLILSDINDCI